MKRSRDSSAERREKMHSSREGSRGARGDATAVNGKSAAPSAAEPMPEVMLQVRAWLRAICHCSVAGLFGITCSPGCMCRES